jgi:Tol biopolymer transport system component
LKVRKSWVAGYAVIAAFSLASVSMAADVPFAATDTVRDGPQTEKKTDGKAPGAGMPVPEVASGATGTEKMPEALEPLFVRPLTKIERGRNDSNPQWSSQGSLIAFERSIGDKKEIHITLPDGTGVQTVYFQLSDGGDTKFFFPGVYEETSYNAGITWSPGEDRFVFMSNGGEGKYDLYLQELGEKTTVRLTDDKEKDGQAHWSPVSDAIVFVSGRTGNGDIYLQDLRTKALSRLTRGGKAYLYPRWSPDGEKIVMMHGNNENHEIVLIADPARPMGSLKPLTTWSYDDLRPVWSPDGRKIAFYSNYNSAGDPKTWCIIVVAADGSDPTEGGGLAAKVVATDVIPDVETGPAWMPDSARIVYVKNDRQEYNPLYVADIVRKTSLLIRTDTKMNHDVTCSAQGTIAFRAQVNQWDQIYIMRLKK